MIGEVSVSKEPNTAAVARGRRGEDDRKQNTVFYSSMLGTAYLLNFPKKVKES
jgi:hypothetical protein